MLSEREIIDRLRRQAARVGPGLRLGIGDDCAVLDPPGPGRLTLITTDTLMEGVHFDLAWHPPELLGRKAVAVNVSDIAASGGESRFALLSLAVPPGLAVEVLEGLTRGIMEALTRHRLTLIGGDTVASKGGLALSVTVLGEAAEGRVLYRSGARPGDLIWVSGGLGLAALGLAICREGRVELGRRYPELLAAHLDPAPETVLGPALAASGLVSAMIDMSDGLATDLAQIGAESGVGARVFAERLPLPDSVREAAASLGLDPLPLAISGGEDYRLLFTSTPEAAGRLGGLARLACGGQLFAVGEVVAGAGVRLEAEGRVTDIAFKGYDHFRGP